MSWGNAAHGTVVPGLKQVLQEAGVLALKSGEDSAGIWHLQAAEETGMPFLEAEESDGFLALSVPLAPVVGVAVGLLPDLTRRMLLWNGQNHGNARFCLCPGRGFCMRAEVVLAVTEKDQQGLKAALSGLSEGWRAYRVWRLGQEENLVGSGGTNTSHDREAINWSELLGGSGRSWTERSDGAAVVSMTDGGVMVSGGADGAMAEMEVADVTDWPQLNKNALGLLLLSLNGRLRLAHGALVMREGRHRAGLRVNLLQPFSTLQVEMALAVLELGVSLCLREVRALESVYLAEKYMEVGVQSLSNQTE